MVWLVRLLRLCVLCLMLTPAIGMAQEQTEAERDVGFLTRTIENNLNSVGRTVTIDGFSGALSSTATIERMTIADSQGVWFQAENLQLHWNRAALLRGSIQIRELRAETINLIRPPVSESTGPSPEATPFALPVLPVSINIGDLQADRINLGAGFLGEEIALSLNGNIALTNGAGNATLEAERLDGPQGTFSLIGAFSNATQILSLVLRVEEEPDGIISTLLNLPGEPSVSLTLAGTGPLSDYTATLIIGTDGVTRVTGQAGLQAVEDTENGNRQEFRLNIRGDITTLLAPQYRSFFGSEVRLNVLGSRQADGSLFLSELDVQAQSLSLTGNAIFAPDGWPRLLALQGEIGAPNGGPVVLPGGNGATVTGVTLNVGYDTEQDDGWTGTFVLSDFRTTGLNIPQLSLDGGGVIVPATDTVPGRFTADMSYSATGVALDDSRMAAAVGDTISGDINLAREDGGPFQISRLTLTGPGIEMNAEGTIDGVESGFLTQSSVTLAVEDASRFAPLTGLDLAGSTELVIVSSVQPFSGMFDVILTGNARDLAFGINALDPLLAGESLISLSASRDTDGTRMEGLSITTPALRADGSMNLTSGSSDAVFDLTVTDAARIMPELSGPATLRGTAKRDDAGAITVDVQAAVPGSTAAISGTMAAPENGGAIIGSVLADIADLSPFADIAGRDLSGSVEAVLSGTLQPDGSLFDITAFSRTRDVTAGIPQVDALLVGAAQLDGRVTRSGPETFRVEGLTITTPAIRATATVDLADGAGDADFDIGLTNIASLVPGLTGPASITGTASRDAVGLVTLDLNGTAPGATLAIGGTVDTPENGFRFNGEMQAAVADIGPYAAIAGQNITGGAELNARGAIRPDLSQIDMVITGQTQNLQTGITTIDPLLTGAGTVNAAVRRSDAGTLSVTDLRVDTPQVNLSGDFDLTDGIGTGNVNLSLPDIAPVAPGFSGPATLIGSATRDTTGHIAVNATVAAPGTNATVTANIAPANRGYHTELNLNGSVANLSAYSQIAGMPLGGSATLQLDGTVTPGANAFDLTVAGQTTNLDLGIPALATVLRGTGTVNGRVRLGTDYILQVNDLALNYPNLTVTANVTGARNTGQARFDARLADVGILVPEFSGPATATGTATLGANGVWQLQVDGTGAGGTNVAVRGSFGPRMNLNLTATGSAPLGLVNSIIEPNRIDGTASFDLRVQGPPALGSVSGTVSIQGARLAVPALRVALLGVGGTVRLAGGVGTVDISGEVEGGGTLSANGTVGLSSPFPADLRVNANAVSLRDATLYQTTATGMVTVTGPITGGARIAGSIDLGQTEIQVPSSGIGVLGDLPEVRHLNPSPPVVLTLARAGLTAEGANITGGGGGTAGIYTLDVTVRALERVFIRGRGLDAELGGEIRITGTTAQIIPLGEFTLIRGRLNILQQRFDLTEGSLQLQGDFIPYVRLVAQTEARTGTTIYITVEGRISEPEVTFSSVPDLPQDEVLAQLIFGIDLASVSPLQAIQLASAVATLAGRGGGGLVEGFRQSAGLDDFDITTDADGNTAVRLGRYITDQIYTDVTVGSRETDINLNFDVTRNLTIKGSVSSDGDTALGLYFERDY